MNIQKLGGNFTPNFRAQTTINAPQNMLSQEEQNQLQELGSKIGTNSDSFEFNISDLHTPTNHPEVKTYTVEHKTHLENSTGVTDSTGKKEIPYERNGQKMEINSPFNYIKKVLSRYI